MMKKTYFLKVLAVSVLLAAVIIASFSSLILSIGEEAVRNGNFVFSVLYSIAWVGLIFWANAKKWTPVQWFSTIYLGITAILYLLMLIMSIFPSLKLSVGLSFAIMLEVFPFFGWSRVITNSIALPAFCFVLTGCMTATAIVPLIRNLKKGNGKP